MSSTENNKKLIIVKLVRPVSTPGHFEFFFGAAGEEPKPFYGAFSEKILEAASNTRLEKLQRVFRRQKRGAILKASEEQIRSLRQHEQGGIWPLGTETKGSRNLFEQGPSQSDQHGQLYEVDASDYIPLEDLNVAVSYANISQVPTVVPDHAIF